METDWETVEPRGYEKIIRGEIKQSGETKVKFKRAAWIKSKHDLKR